MDEKLTRLQKIGIIPVVVIENESEAEAVGRALLDGGLPTMEITFRTGAAGAAIAVVARSCPSILLGAGTVLTVEQAEIAINAGASYIVSPGLRSEVIRYCLGRGVAAIPGVLTPTEIGSAMDFGLDVVKFFPAEAGGGVKTLKALSAPFVNMKFIPTGGIDETNASSYLRLPCVAACGGSWMVKKELISAKRFDEISALASRAVELVRSTRCDPKSITGALEN